MEYSTYNISSDEESPSLHYLSLSSEDSDITRELIIEPYPLEWNHDDPPEVYAQIDELIEKDKKQHSFNNDEYIDLNDLRPRKASREEFMRISLGDYDEFRESQRFRSSTPFDDLVKNNSQKTEVQQNAVTEEEKNDENPELGNDIHSSRYYLPEDNSLRRVNVCDAEVQVDLLNAWNSIKSQFFEKTGTYEIRKAK